MSRAIGIYGMALVLVACGQGGQVAQTTAALQSAEEVAVLAFLNDQQNTVFEVLDVDCGLRSDSAKHIIKHRDGQDKTPGTADDNLFDSLDELDAVHMVGQWTIDQLKACADGFGYTPTPNELDVVNFLNDAGTDFARLDVDCALRSDAAQNLIAHRDGADGTFGTADDNPFHSQDEVDGVFQVGPVTLDLLGQCAADFGFGDGEPEPAPAPDPQQCQPAAWDGTFDQEEYFWDASQVSSDLAALIPFLQADADSRRDTSVYFPVRFGDIYQHSLGGEVVHYQVGFLQTIDPEGVQLWFYYHLDSCLNLVDFWMGI